MDRKSWPWKKKSSDKITTDGSLASSSPNEKDGKEGKKPKYVQISMASYTHLNGLEDQVKSYEEQVQGLEEEIRELNEKLCEANSEIKNKEDLVKQHTKVAEEAVSGWEKAEAEATALKNHLESVTLLKLTAEDRAAHLDGALKECMRQIRNLKEENEHKLQDMAVSKAKVFDKMKMELEGKIFDLDQELLRAAAENDALSRTLQERSNILMKLSEEKAQAEVQIELLKTSIESCEKEVSCLKYELHIAKKEVEIRNEEKNMSVRSADAANKQHLEGLKKVSKLEAECQRLRGLVRKKLPGPAALAQMKLEVENLGRDSGESRLRRSSGKPPPHSSEFSPENAQKFIKENEYTERLIAMEEETKMLKEILARRNSELQACRNLYAETASKLQSLEAEFQANGEQLSLLKSSHVQNDNKLPNFASHSEEVIDDNGSSAGSWSTGLASELSNFKREKNVNIICSRNLETAPNLDLMDDFLEMEKLACSTNETVSDADFSNDKTGPPADPHVFTKLRSLVSMALDSMCNETDREKTMENVKHLIEDMNDFLLLQLAKFVSDHVDDSSYPVNETVTDIDNTELKLAAARISEFIVVLGREAKLLPDAALDGAGLNLKIDVVSTKYSRDMENNINMAEFVLDISEVFAEASKLRFNFLGINRSESEAGSSDCIDKIALLESKAVVDFSDTSSDPDVPNAGNLVPTSETGAAASWKCSLEEFEQLKLDKDKMAADLARSMENFENTKSHLQETEHALAEIKSQLSLAQKSNSLADTQLKCMAESYKSLETRAEELLVEVNCLQGRIDNLETVLQDERKGHQEALNRCKELQEKLERIDVSGAAGDEDKASQEKELAAAAEKLAECQETIFLLGKKLKDLRSPMEIVTLSANRRSQKSEIYGEESPTVSGITDSQDAAVDATSETDTTFLQRTGLESPLSDVFSATFSPDSDLLTSPLSSSKPPKHRPSASYSGYSSSPTPSRGFSRFFSS
ncbi:hypothetical protein M569_06029, partial [Genlisea aurea]